MAVNGEVIVGVHRTFVQPFYPISISSGDRRSSSISRSDCEIVSEVLLVFETVNFRLRDVQSLVDPFIPVSLAESFVEECDPITLPWQAAKSLVSSHKLDKRLVFDAKRF